MKNYSFYTLALAVLAAVFCVPASAQTNVLQRCEKPLAEAEQMSQSIADCSSALDSSRMALAAVQKATTGPEERVETSSTPLSVDMTRAAMTEPLHGRLISHYAYAAFAAGDAAQCSGLAPIGSAQVTLCRTVVADLDFVRARYGSDSALSGACRRTDSESGPGASACCTALAEARKGPNPCASMAPKCLDGATCRAVFGSWGGDATACRSLPMPDQGDCKGDECARLHGERIANCEADASFARAFKAKNSAECGTSERCRALMGAGKAVAQEIAARDMKNPVGAWFLKSAWKTPSVVARSRGPVKPLPPVPGTAASKIDFKGFVCAEPMFSKENRLAATAVLTAAHVCLTDVETATALPSRGLAEAIDEREEKLIRLNLRLNKYFEGGKTAKAPAPAPK